MVSFTLISFSICFCTKLSDFDGSIRSINKNRGFLGFFFLQKVMHVKWNIGKI